MRDRPMWGSDEPTIVHTRPYATFGSGPLIPEAYSQEEDPPTYVPYPGPGIASILAKPGASGPPPLGKGLVWFVSAAVVFGLFMLSVAGWVFLTA